MKIKYTLFFFFAVLIFKTEDINGQEVWKKLELTNYSKQNKNLYEKKNFPSKYELVSLNIEGFKKNMNCISKKESSVIKLPNANGSLSSFIIKETSNLDEVLQAKFPNIKSYSAQGIDDPTAVAKISIGTDGLHGVVFSGNGETVYIDPYSRDNKDYIVYKRNSLNKPDEDFKCEVEQQVAKKDSSTEYFARNADDGKLRTFRLALVCSGEYADFHLGVNQQNIPASATDQVKKEAVLSAMNTSMTRINGVFEKDLSVKLVIVADNDKVIFLDKDTDGITDGSADTMINQVQSICDNQIGSANYDIGHIFSIGGSGLAGLGVVCINGQKGRGVTGIASPVSDPYDIDYVAHEIGHQFGATHTFNNSCDGNRTNATAVEPGSGSTIMAYAGICSPNVVTGNANGNSDDHFHAVSIAQMWNLIGSSANCATLTDTNNIAPTANAGIDYIVPKSTPFKLTGSATDVDDGNSLTYNWEQIDNEIATMAPLSTNTVGPMFRSLSSKATPTRYFPEIETVIAGNGSTGSIWERIPSVARDLNFSFFVRDNNLGGGATARDDMKVTIADVDPFSVTTPSSAVSWNTGTTQTVTWDKGGTDSAPINCNFVNIRLSLDGGLTYPVSIKENSPNDGTESFVVPDNATTIGRIMVEAVDNVFYGINSVNFSIISTTPTFLLTESNGIKDVCNAGNESVNYTFSLDFINGFSENVSFTTTGHPSGSSVVFNPNSINTDGTVTMTISNLDGKTPQDYVINVVGNSTSVSQNIDVTLRLTSSTFNSVTLSSPSDNETNVSIVEQLSWVEDSNSTSYNVQIASDSNFSNIVSSGDVATNSYTASGLFGETVYYWRVKPKNSCGEGDYSTAFSFTTEIPEYCASTFTDIFGGNEHITNVTFNTLNNDSGNDVGDGYQDFTASTQATATTIVTRGDVHEISVTFNTSGYQSHCYVFVDWNRDFQFDESTERYDLGIGFDDDGNSSTTDEDTLTFNITVPSDANFGDTKMRVIVEYADGENGYGEGACKQDHKTEWGETEDYKVTVDGTASIEDISFKGFNLYPNPTKGEFKLNFEVVSINDDISVQLFDIRGRLIDEKKYLNRNNTLFSENIVFEKTSSGLYLLKVTNGNVQVTRKFIIK